MTYVEFKNIVKETFNNYFTVNFEEFEIIFQNFEKVNMGDEFVGLRKKNVTGFNAAPMLPLTSLYAAAITVNDIPGVLKKAAILLEDSVINPVVKDTEFNPELIKQNTIIQVINTEWNKKLLAGLPHRDMLDISIVYRWVVDVVDDGLGSALITNAMFERLGISEEELFDLALENTLRIFPPKVMNLDDLFEHLTSDIEPDEVCESCTGMLVLTNEENYYGANALLDDSLLQEVATAADCDLYILPASIHELMVLPAVTDDTAELVRMVRNINKDVVDVADRLSDNLYLYKKEDRTINLITLWEGDNE